MVEIRTSLWSIHSIKAFGVDGMSFGFYKKYWDIVSSNIIAFVQEFFCIGRMLPEINETMIMLVQKRDHHMTISYYRIIVLFIIKKIGE